MTSGSEYRLFVYLATNKIGELVFDRSTDSLSLNYDQHWQQTGFALSPHLPLHKAIDPIVLKRYLNNLFPEGNGFDYLLENYRISKNNTFGIIKILGNDTAAGLSFYADDNNVEQQGGFRPISDVELISRLEQRESNGLVVWDGKPRLSVAGVQDKINVVLDKHGNIGFGEGRLCSTHILKFEQKRQSHLVLNEYIVMRLCKTIKIPVADVEIRRYGKHPCLLVRRFDRKQINETQVLRRYIIDACQALNLPPEYKYERNFGSTRDVKHIRDGASLPKLFALCQHARTPAAERKLLLDRVMFSLCVNNHDAHGKNFSYFLGKSGTELAPAYDLVNISLYPEFDQEMAMALGDEFDSQTVNAYQLADFADSCKLPRKLVANSMKNISYKLLQGIARANFSDVTPIESERRFTAALLQNIQERCEHLLEEAKGIVGMDV